MENNLTQIQEFINQWKERAKEYYLQEFEMYTNRRREYNECMDHSYSNMLWEKLKKDVRDKVFSTLVVDSYSYGQERGKERIYKKIDKDAMNKEKILIARVNKEVGLISEALDLYVGYNGELNGHIKGENGICKIETIYAGGYNIQCLHYRVLVHKLK